MTCIILTRPLVDGKVDSHISGECGRSVSIGALRSYRTNALLSCLIVNVCGLQLVNNFRRPDHRQQGTNKSTIHFKINLSIGTVVHPANDVGAGVNGPTWLIARLIAA